MTLAFNCARHDKKEKMKCFIYVVSFREIFLSVSIFHYKTELDGLEQYNCIPGFFNSMSSGLEKQEHNSS